MAIPFAFSKPVEGPIATGEFKYKDRVQYAADVFNAAVLAFNKGSIKNFSDEMFEHVEAKDLKSLEGVVRTKDRLPSAFIVGGTSVKFLYVNKNTFEEAGLVLDFTKIEQGILEVNNVQYTYNQSRSFVEWFELLSTGQSDMARFFSLVPMATASGKGLLAGIGAVFAVLFLGKRNKSQGSSSRPRVAKKPLFKRSSKSSTASHSGLGIFRKSAPAKREASAERTVTKKVAPAPAPTPVPPLTTRKVASSSEDNSENKRKSDYTRSVSSNLGRHVANIAMSRLGKGVPNTQVANKNLRCAEQATLILVQAGVLESRYVAVTTVVRKLKSMGWEVSDTPVPGAVAYSRDAFPETKKIPGESSVRPHIGVVGTDLAVYHNSGPAGGIIVRSTAQDSDRNGKWVKYAVKYLIPPDAKVAQMILNHFFKGGLYAQVQAAINNRS